jgi:hypothetical protein
MYKYWLIASRERLGLWLEVERLVGREKWATVGGRCSYVHKFNFKIGELTKEDWVRYLRAADYQK